MEISPNWKQLSSQLAQRNKKFKRNEPTRVINKESKIEEPDERNRSNGTESSDQRNDLVVALESRFATDQRENKSKLGKFIALYCEFVGIGSKGTVDALAKVTVVNYHGKVLLDSYVKPVEKAVDYRKSQSGITQEQLSAAPSFTEIQARVNALIDGKIVVGYDLKRIFRVLLLSHPKKKQRDISTFEPLLAAMGEGTPSLRQLARIHLNIHGKMPNSPEASLCHAQICMLLYRKCRPEWEATYNKPVKTNRPVKQEESALFSSSEEE